MNIFFVNLNDFGVISIAKQTTSSIISENILSYWKALTEITIAMVTFLTKPNLCEANRNHTFFNHLTRKIDFPKIIMNSKQFYCIKKLINTYIVMNSKQFYCIKKLINTYIVMNSRQCYKRKISFKWRISLVL